MNDLFVTTSSQNDFLMFWGATQFPSFSGNYPFNNKLILITYNNFLNIYSGANYSKIAPANSFINALEMTPKNLAAHLKILDGNDRLYYRHFWWKGSYEVNIDVILLFAVIIFGIEW